MINPPPHLKWIQPPALPHMLYLTMSAGLRCDTRVEAWVSGLGQHGDVLYGCHVFIFKDGSSPCSQFARRRGREQEYLLCEQIEMSGVPQLLITPMWRTCWGFFFFFSDAINANV